MRLNRLQSAPQLLLHDLDGLPVEVGGGKKILLSIFREAACPFCNFRVFELTRNARDLSKLGLEIVVVFASDEQDVRRFIAKQPRPFRMVADPANTAHRIYGVERSMRGKLKAVFTRLPAMLRGLWAAGLTSGKRTGHLMPADFLIDGDGKLVDIYYGRDAGDHIPIERIEQFAARGLVSRTRDISALAAPR